MATKHQIHRMGNNPAPSPSNGERLKWLVPVGVAIVLVGFIGVIIATSGVGESDDPPEGTIVLDEPDRNHVEGEVIYDPEPPVGGNHQSVWQNCGVYAEPVVDEKAVHSLEHGAVWITYRPDLPQDQIDQLESKASGQTHVLVSPHEKVGNPIAVSAWGRQMRVDDAGDGRIDQFIRAFQRGPQTPEPGARCSGGIGTPA